MLLVEHRSVQAHLDPWRGVHVLTVWPLITPARLRGGPGELVAFPLSVVGAIRDLTKQRKLLKDLSQLRALLSGVGPRVGAINEVIPRISEGKMRLGLLYVPGSARSAWLLSSVESTIETADNWKCGPTA